MLDYPLKVTPNLHFARVPSQPTQFLFPPLFGLGFAPTKLLRQGPFAPTTEQDQHIIGPPQVALQVEEPRFTAPSRGLEKTANRLLQLLSCALARLDKTGPARVGLKLVFQQNGQTVGNVPGLDQGLRITIGDLG